MFSLGGLDIVHRVEYIGDYMKPRRYFCSKEEWAKMTKAQQNAVAGARNGSLRVDRKLALQRLTAVR